MNQPGLFVTSSFLWQRRGSDFQTATLAAWQPSNRLHITLRHLRAATIQSSRRHERPSISTGRTTPLSLAILSTRPIRVRPTQSEHSGQRIDACERLSPPRSNSSQDDENHPISGRSPPRKGHPREKDVTIPNQGNRRRIPQPRPPRGRTARPVAGRLLEASPPTNKKRRSPEQPALSFLSFANAFLVLFAREAPAPPLAPSARASAYLGKPVHPGQETHLAREGRPRP